MLRMSGYSSCSMSLAYVCAVRGCSARRRGQAHKHEVNDTLEIHLFPKVLVVPAREACPNAVVDIHHARHSVKAEAVKAILLHVETEVGQEEAQDFVVAVIEEPAVPELMTSLAAFVEVKVIGAVEEVQTVENVLARVRVNDVEEDSDPHRVRDVDELLEVLGVAIAGTGGEETRHLVPECYPNARVKQDSRKRAHRVDEHA